MNKLDKMILTQVLNSFKAGDLTTDQVYMLLSELGLMRASVIRVNKISNYDLKKLNKTTFIVGGK